MRQATSQCQDVRNRTSLYLYHSIYFTFSWICGKESLKDHQEIVPDGTSIFIILLCKGDNLSTELFTEKEVSTPSKSYLCMQNTIYKLMLMVVVSGLGDFSAFTLSLTLFCIVGIIYNEFALFIYYENVNAIDDIFYHC